MTTVLEAEAIEQEYYGVGNKAGLAEGVPYAEEADGDAAVWIRSQSKPPLYNWTHHVASQLGGKKKQTKLY